MLGKLVNKFKRQTLQDGVYDGSASPPAQLSPPPPARGSGDGPTTRRSARLNEQQRAAGKERGGGSDGAGGGGECNNTGAATPISTSETAEMMVGMRMQSSPSPPNTRARRAQLEAATAAVEQQRAAVLQQYQQNQQLLHQPQPFSTTSTTASMMKQFGGIGSGGSAITSTALARPLRPMTLCCDSGTESDDEDDEELEMLDSLSNASRAALEEGIGRSPPTLTSSPPLISEFDTSSWDSCGCESGIVLRESAERDDASRNVDLLEAALGGGEPLSLVGIARRAPSNNKKRGSTSATGGGERGGGGCGVDPSGGAVMTAEETAGTTPVQSKDAFPTNFHSSSSLNNTNSSTNTRSLPIDFSALRHSELYGSPTSAEAVAASDDAPTPIGSHKGPGAGVLLMEMAVAAGKEAAVERALGTPSSTTTTPTNLSSLSDPPSSQQNQQGQQESSHQGAFRRVLRRTRRNSSSQTLAGAAATRTVSPLGVGLGEKRRWGELPPPASATAPTGNPNGVEEFLLERSETPIAARTRAASMLLNAAGAGLLGAAGIGDSAADRPVLTAARRTRVRVLYSSANQQQKAGGNLPFHQVPLVQGRRGQVAPMLGQSPPYILANKRGRHCSKTGAASSPPRPSLNFDKMRKRMLNNNGGPASTAADDEAD